MTMSTFKNLERACGGNINPDTLRVFERNLRQQEPDAIVEYAEFMKGMRALFAPVEENDEPHCGKSKIARDWAERNNVPVLTLKMTSRSGAAGSLDTSKSPAERDALREIERLMKLDDQH